MEHRDEELPAFDLVGVSVRASNERAMETIGPLWGRVYAGEWPRLSVGRTRLYAVYSNYESDHAGEYDFLIGIAAAPDDDPPDQMVRLHVPAQRYAVVTARGEMPGALFDAWGRIWEAALPRAYGADFEIHDPDSPEAVEIRLSVDSPRGGVRPGS